MASRVSSKLKFTRKDNDAKGTITKGISVNISGTKSTITTYSRKKKK